MTRPNAAAKTCVISADDGIRVTGDSPVVDDDDNDGDDGEGSVDARPYRQLSRARDAADATAPTADGGADATAEAAPTAEAAADGTEPPPLPPPPPPAPSPSPSPAPAPAPAPRGRAPAPAPKRPAERGITIGRPRP